MEPKTRKALSWSLSVLVHAGLLFFVIRAGIQYALPEGEVVAGQSIDVVENQTPGAQIKAAAANREAPISTAPSTPTSKATTANESRTADAPEESQPHFIPDKEPQDVMPEDKAQEEAQDEPEAEPVTKPETTETSDDQKAPEVPVTPKQEKPQAVQEDPQADNAAAQGTPAQAPTAQAQAPAQEQNKVPAQASNEGQAPQDAGETNEGTGTGPQGPMLDETKLTEISGNEKPSYPWIAKLRHQEGTVILRAFIKKDGNVDLPILAQSSGFPTLDKECIRAYSQWKYKPGLSGWVLKPFRFILKK